MAFIAGLSDKNLSCNSVQITQESCFPMVAEPGAPEWGEAGPL